MDKYHFPKDPIPNPDATISGPKYRFTILHPFVLRYEWAEDGNFEDRASTFAINRNFSKPGFRVKDGDFLEIITSSLHLTYDKQEPSPNGLSVQFPWGADWRYGQDGADGNLGGTARTLDGVNGRCDMGLGILSRNGFSYVDDSESMLFSDDGFVTPRRKGKRIDGYLFAYDKDFKGAMQAFYAISGSQPAVPRWALGNWWSRYHAYDEKEYLDLMGQFRAEGVPLSVAVLDMDWHWVKEKFVTHNGWTGYSWNTDLFPEPEEFARKLHDRDLKITLNDHPHEGVHSFEDVYEELAKRLGHDIKNQDPIQFDPTSQSFMSAYFSLVHRRLEKMCCDFWWTDWQQGPYSRISGFDPLWLLNHFQYLDTKQANPSSLPMIFSRYAGPGSHRYPVGFSGDTIATWASLQFQPEFTATASNIGFGWWSHDIGGHMPGERNDECAARWVQYAVFSPVLRLHSTRNQWMSKEPWLYRPECRDAMREAMRFRHRLVPYIYSSAGSKSKNNLSLIQPLYWGFPGREEAYRFPNEYFFGPSLVISPIVDPRDQRTNLAKTKLWLPPKRHVDIFTGVVYDGDRELQMYRSLSSIPALAPEGSIIPLERASVPENGCKNPDAYRVTVVVGQDGDFDIIEDSRDDPEYESGDEPEQRTLNIAYNQSSGQLSFDRGSNKAWTFRFMSTQIDPSSIKVHANNGVVEEARCTIGSHGEYRHTVARIPASPQDHRVVIDLGPDPQLDVLDHTESIRKLLLDFQLDFKMKDRIWEIIEADQPTTIKMGRLLSLVLDEVFLGPIVELLLADSRPRCWSLDVE